MPGFDHTAPFIWAAYGLSALVLLALLLATVWRARAAKARLERLNREEGEP